MAALRAETSGRVRFDGIGGPRMEAEGLASRVPISELAVMGLLEVVPHLPRVLSRIRETVEVVRRLRPAALVTIDSPSFSLRISKRLAGEGIPLVHFVAPTVWAWRPRRAKKVAAFLDHLIALLPFEPPYFERHGLSCEAVGYPAIEDSHGGDGEGFRRRRGIPSDAPILCAMPGSRRKEVRRLLPVFRETIARLAGEVPGLQVVLPTVANVADTVSSEVAAWPVPVHLVPEPEERRHAFAASTAALVKSGTGSVELAAAGVPAVVTQRLSWATAFLFLLLSRVKFVSIVNLLAGREVQPERLQHRCRPGPLVEALRPFFLDPEARRRTVEAGLEAARALGLGGTPPSVLAARAVLRFTRATTSASGASAAPPGS
jgi:lipid-A-disaccharide synthase